VSRTLYELGYIIRIVSEAGEPSTGRRLRTRVWLHTQIATRPTHGEIAASPASMLDRVGGAIRTIITCPVVRGERILAA
jgi:hypothetical protein